MITQKIYTADLDFPCRELSLCSLGFVVALLVHSGIRFFVCVYLRNNPAVTYLLAVVSTCTGAFSIPLAVVSDCTVYIFLIVLATISDC